MIADSIEFVRKVLRDYIGVADDEVIIDAARTLVGESNKRGCYLSLVNLEEEAALRNLSHTERRQGQMRRVEPPVHLNLYLLIAFEFQTYPMSLVHLSKTIELFQRHRFFDATTQTGPGAVAFPAGAERLVFEMVNMNFEALNNLWGILGGSHFPSVVYKVRLIRIQARDDAAEPEVADTALQILLMK